MPLKKQAGSVFQMKVTLKHSKPPIWRRTHLDSNTTLFELHAILQLSMGWTNSHLHQFIANGIYYGEPHPDFGLDVLDEQEYQIHQIVNEPGDKFIYEYDFGDGWEHEVVLEEKLAFEPNTKYPCCIKGKRRCPPEDIGGVWGYEYFLEALLDINHPEHEQYKEWIDGSYDSEEFDLEEVNQMLRHYL